MTRLQKFLTSGESCELKAPKRITKENKTPNKYEVKFLTHNGIEYTFAAAEAFGEGTISFHHKGQMENLNLNTGTQIGGYIFYLVNKFTDLYKIQEFQFSGADEDLNTLYSTSSFKTKIAQRTKFSFLKMQNGNFVYNKS